WSTSTRVCPSAISPSRSWREGEPAPPARTELLRLAAWRASRSGLDDTLLHPATGKPEPATAVVGLLLEHCREALTDTGDADTVAGLLPALLTRGNGASFQRAAYHRSGRLTDVIRGAVAVTETGLYRPARRFCWVEGLP